MGKFQAPKGTRDLYPDDVLRQRYITQAWRDVSIRHGFDEIIGPTFEHPDIYKLKSGEGIVSELFSFRREGGDDDYALRPEFTPTLARMYAARARQLPQPTKWFTAGPYFRAEKPQRGRLREFLQWNVDVMGLPGGLNAEDAESAEGKAQADAEVIDCAVVLLEQLGLEAEFATVKISDRDVVTNLIQDAGVNDQNIQRAFELLDRHSKMDETSFVTECTKIGLIFDTFVEDANDYEQVVTSGVAWVEAGGTSQKTKRFDFAGIHLLLRRLEELGAGSWAVPNLKIVRGLAYYTGTVFEVIADGERAVCGGGRYDKLVEMFGGPATPAVGFGMGDVVLSLLLDDKGLM
ncbi:hypothetical protein DRQ53_15350, partial [bacterium]